MPKKVQKTFRVTDEGALRPRSKARWLREQIQLFGGGKVVITMERPTRSLAQNRFYWGYVIRPIRIAMLDAGIEASSEAIHQHYKRKYLDPDIHEMVDPTTGEVQSYRTYTTTNLSETDFHDYVELIKMDEAIRTLGAYIPDPGEDVPLSYA